MSKRPTDYLANPAQGLAAIASVFVSIIDRMIVAKTFGLEAAEN